MKETLAAEPNKLPDEKDLFPSKKAHDPKLVEIAERITELNLLELSDLCDILKVCMEMKYTANYGEV